MQKYWVCWNKKRGAFKVDHDSLEIAQAEATRLVKRDGDPIDILECMQQAKPQDVPVVFDFAHKSIDIHLQGMAG